MSPLDYPIEECAKTAESLIADGATIYQKWTCLGCGERKTMVEPDVFFTQGKCEECGHVTDLTKTGCNYLVHKVLA